MSRTRGSSHRFHQDDGVLLGKGGEPIPVPMHQPVRLDRNGAPISPVVANMQMPIRRLSGHTVLQGPGAEAVPAPPPIVAYRADKASWNKNMQAYELAFLLDMVLKDMGGLSVEVSQEVFNTMKGDFKQHFMPVRRAVSDD